MTDDETKCPYCGCDYSDPNGLADDGYMYTGHVTHDCPDPDLMERAWLRASPMEREEVWP